MQCQSNQKNDIVIVQQNSSPYTTKSKTTAIIGARDVADGAFPFHHTPALEVQFIWLKTVTLN